MTEEIAPIVPGRSCAGCTQCCKLLSIDELSKPRQQWCEQCDIGVGCKIYDTKPPSCTAFNCGYLLNPEFGEEWHPAKCRMVLSFEPHANRIVVHVDAGRLDAWKREPYYSQIKRWSVASAQVQGQVVVWQGLDAVVVLPHTDKNLGRVRADQLIITSERRTPQGIMLDAFLVDRDDPRVAGMQQPDWDNPARPSGSRRTDLRLALR